jgi:hypothetical protein
VDRRRGADIENAATYPFPSGELFGHHRRMSPKPSRPEIFYMRQLTYVGDDLFSFTLTPTRARFGKWNLCF